VVQLLFTALVLAMAVRSDDVSAFLLGPLLVFTWLVVNMYYWNMLGLVALGFALRKERRWLYALLWLHFNFALFYVYQHLNRGFAEGYIVALSIASGIVAIGGGEAWELYKAKWSPFAAATEPAAATASGKSKKRSV
jgi:hypothetical protein